MQRRSSAATGSQDGVQNTTYGPEEEIIFQQLTLVQIISFGSYLDTEDITVPREGVGHARFQGRSCRCGSTLVGHPMLCTLPAPPRSVGAASCLPDAIRLCTEHKQQPSLSLPLILPSLYN